MKNKDLKEGKESIIGKIIYGFLLFMPLLAIAVTCLYTIFNKNAYLSTSGIKKTESTTYLNTLNNPAELPTGEEITYYFTDNIETNTSNSYSSWFNFDSISIEDLNPTAYRFRIRYNVTPYDIQFNQTNNTYFTIPLQDFTFTLDSYTRSDTGTTYCNNIYYITYVTTTTLDDAFYYAVDKTEQSNLFNWSKNSIIYTGVNATCNELNITNTFIPMLLTYWLLISVIYILYDIILMILIILHNRIHRLQDSMS